MEIRGSDSSLPPPDNGKRQSKKQPVEKQVKTDSIELSGGAGKETTPNASAQVKKGADVDKTHAGISGDKAPSTLGIDKISAGDSVSPRSQIENNPKIIGDRIEISVDARRAGKIALARERVESGYYNQPENIEKLADILIDKLNLKSTENN